MRGCERVECDLLDAVSCGLECGRAHRGENSRNSGRRGPIDCDTFHTPRSESPACRSRFVRCHLDPFFFVARSVANVQRDAVMGCVSGVFFFKARRAARSKRGLADSSREFTLAAGDGIYPHEAVLVTLAS